MTSKEPFDELNLNSSPSPVSSHASPDLIDHIDDWLEYLVKLVETTTDFKTRKKYDRQIKYVVRFRCGANCNVSHNTILAKYYLGTGEAADETSDGIGATAAVASEAAELGLYDSMAIHASTPMQPCYLTDTYAYSQVQKALACEDLFFLQGPPGTGKTTAIVEIILQTLRSKPGARILITSETHVAVDNALDRLTSHLSETEMNLVMRYPRFSVATLENPAAFAVQAYPRANAVWGQASEVAPELTERLWQRLERGRKNDDGTDELPRWMVRNLADRHQVIGVTCNQLDHFMDTDSDMFDLAIIDECSKATLPEWLMALTIARKCILVGDHKQLPPTFCQEESEALSELDHTQEKLIRDGVIERIFDNFPMSKKGTLLKQYRMLPEIGSFISKHFYNNGLDHSRTEGNGLFEHFAWLTYDSRNYYVPPERGNERKTLINHREIKIILDHLGLMCQQISKAKRKAAGGLGSTSGGEFGGVMNDADGASITPPQSEKPESYFTEGRKLSVAVITPYRAQCKELKRALGKHDFTEHLTIEVDTVDAFQGRQADVVFFSFVRTVGPAKFYADDRRMNVAISRARDCVYLVGSIDYIRRKRLPALTALAGRPVLSS